MLSILTGKFRTPSMPHAVLIGIIVLCGCVDLPRNLSIAGTTLLGAATLACVGIIWSVFFTRPVVPNYLLKTVLFLIFFEMYCTATLIWAHTGIDGIQMLTVGLNFLGCVLVAARLTSEEPEIGHSLFRAVLLSSSIAVVIYSYVVFIAGDDTEGFLTGRAFALYTLTPVAICLAQWRNFHQSRSIATQSVIWAIVMTGVVAASESRTALVVCAILFPLAVFLRLNTRSIVISVVMLVSASAMLGSAIMLIPSLHHRFFADDASMKVGGVAINASGRTKIWDVVLSSVGDDWFFGKGVASSQVLVRAAFNEHVGQPHNDYIRYYYDTGALGLSLWGCFAVAFLYRTIANLRRSIREQSTDYAFHLAALLAFCAVSFAMTTDNPVVYSYVMMPLGIVIGCSLGAGRPKTQLAPGRLPDYFPAPQPLSRNVRIVS